MNKGQKLSPNVNKCHQRLTKVTKCHRRSPKITNGQFMYLVKFIYIGYKYISIFLANGLKKKNKNHQKTPKVTRGHQRSPKVNLCNWATLNI